MAEGRASYNWWCVTKGAWADGARRARGLNERHQQHKAGYTAVLSGAGARICRPARSRLAARKNLSSVPPPPQFVDPGPPPAYLCA
ncbi:hypothetical protein HMPREF9946_00144 [Acetobacteraceae bacterium AT-5844]|nr:hypothetical protein HMPREF9946_00144 [Acetobacteraceae bacterium AT-5844]